MSEEIEVVSDGDGLAVVGKRSAIERFLTELGLLEHAQDFGLDKLRQVAQVAESVANSASEIAEKSGLWLKLTKESAEKIKELGLIETSTPGVSYAMIGDPGSMKKWVQVHNASGSALSNPAVLAGAAGMMGQLARQAEVREIKAYLASIDQKLDRARRELRDFQLSKMDGVVFQVSEALKIKDLTGYVSDVNWSKVQAASAAIGETQSYALRQLDANADKIDDAKKIGDLSSAVRDVEGEVAVWLAVLGRSFELQESVAVVELARVAAAAPDDLNAHRAALSEAREERRRIILVKTARLMDRMITAAGSAQLNVLLHLPAARAIVDSVQRLGESIDEFHEPLGIEPATHKIGPVRFVDALRDWSSWKAAATEAGPKLAIGGLVVGGVVLYLHPKSQPLAKAALKAASDLMKK